MTAPFAGVKVLDFTQVAAGPTCTMMLGDMGADVIKVEPPSGDLCRALGPPWLHGESAIFLGLNRNKRSIVIDLKKPDGAQVAMTIARRCDIVVESFRPGVADRLGIGYEAVRAANPAVIYCSVTAYGPDGPWRDKPGVDGIVQGVSGLMSIIGNKEDLPSKVQTPIVDSVTGYMATSAILAAFILKERKGIGQKIDVNMYNSALMLQQISLCTYLASGQVPERIGSAAPYAAPNEALPTQDGWIMIAAYQEGRWRALCQVLERPDLAEDKRFVDLNSRVKNRRELFQVLSDMFRRKRTQEWVETLEAADIMCGPISTYDQVVASSQIHHTKLLQEMDHPVAGKISMPGFGINFSAASAITKFPPPLLGQQTTEILSSFGFSTEEIRNLFESQVVMERDPTA